MQMELLMNKALKYILLTAAGALLLAGCQKTGISGQGDGTIRFKISAGTAGTKTAYGETAGSWQSIDWKVNDQIRIYSNVATDRYSGRNYSDYKITGVTAGTSATNPSKATLSEDQNGLVWGDEPATYHFYGIYPPTDCTNGAAGILGGTIPATGQTGDPADVKDYGFLTAAASVTLKDTDFDALKTVKFPTDGGPDVTLAFEPAFTAFEIVLKAAEGVTNPIPVKGFKLVSGAEPVAGAFTVDCTGSTKAYASTSTTNEISFSFPENTAVSADGDPLTFTVFALPLDFSQLKLEFTVLEGENPNPMPRSLRLTYATDVTDKHAKGDYITFGACKKHIITGLAMPDGISLFSVVTVDPLAEQSHTIVL